MQLDKLLPLKLYIGWDSREAVAADVCKHSIAKRTTTPLSIEYLKHRDLRKRGLFSRPWITLGASGSWIDPTDEKPFSTEFSHTRFLVPELMQYKGWALFLDSDMICLTDIAKLFALCDDKYAVMCVKHTHVPPLNSHKMDGREQLRYRRKNWSSFVLWNCSHPANARITKEAVGFMRGTDLHAFSWLTDDQIGELPPTYNYIAGVSPKLAPERGGIPDVIHYTEGGPWFPECQEVPYAGMWIQEYEDMQCNGEMVICDVPSIAYEKEEIIRK
jgi:lipopolysaccharide biosynthesis glycosyltransferase